MIIAHASAERIEELDTTGPYFSCMCFQDIDSAAGWEDDASELRQLYNLAGKVRYVYSFDAETIDCSDLDEYEDEIQQVIEDMIDEWSFLDADSALECLRQPGLLIDLFFSNGSCSEPEDLWLLQGYKGLAAKAAGFDAAIDSDEQGECYIACCERRELTETCVETGESRKIKLNG